MAVRPVRTSNFPQNLISRLILIFSSVFFSDADIEEYLKRFYDEKFSNSARSAGGSPVDFVQSKFNPPPCGHGDRLKKAGRRRKARN